MLQRSCASRANGLLDQGTVEIEEIQPIIEDLIDEMRANGELPPG